jgi:hypothetical protein
MYPSTQLNFIFPTSDLIANFNQETGHQLASSDALELLFQLFNILATNCPLDMRDQDFLDLSRFRFLSIYKHIDLIPIEVKSIIHKAAYAVLVQMHVRMEDTEKLSHDKYKDYLPYLMIGNRT